MDSLVDLPQRTHVNGYRIERRLGMGGFGITYLASDLDAERIERRALALNRRIARYLGADAVPETWRRWAARAAGPMVAIKEYFYSGVAVRMNDDRVSPASSEVRTEYAVGLESFLDEAHIAEGLFHPNVVTVFDVFEENNTAYYVMESVSGETLESRIERHGRQDADVVGRWLAELLDGLDYLHGRGVLHLDLSPQNVILRSGAESPVLIDFGASRAVAQQKTRNFGRMVNDGYSPPEKYLFGASKLQVTADIYSAAALVAFALDGATPPSAMLRTEDHRLAPILDGAPELMRRAILQALVLDARRRPQDVAAWRKLGVLPKTSVQKPKSVFGQEMDPTAPDAPEESRLQLALRTTILPVAIVAAATLVIISGLFLLLPFLSRAPIAPEGRLIQEAQTLYCANDGQGGAQAMQARTAFLKDLNTVIQKGSALAPEAAFRLGAHTMGGKGGFLEGFDGAPVCGSAQSCLQTAVDRGYQPAIIFLDALDGQSTLSIQRAGLKNLTTALDNWPPGLHPMDCRAKVDLNPQDWTGS